MLLIFHLGRPDVLPVDDFGVRAGFQFMNGLRKMPTPKALALYGERWGPYRSAAAWYLWRAVELKKAGKLPEPIEQIRLPRVLKARRKKADAKPSAKRRVATGKANAPRKSAGGSRTTTPRKSGAGSKTATARASRARPRVTTKAKSKRAYK
jgi:hypothetical protein